MATPAGSRIGEIVDEHYRVVEHIADGGMAAVFRAEHVNTRVSFALKVLHPEFSDNEEVAARFQREVQAYRRVQHPHVVGASDFGRLPDGSLYMVLEYVSGKDLCTVLFHEGPFAPDRAVKIALQVALGLVPAHAAGVIHRDLKPENIMLLDREDDPDFVKILDFGIARVPVRGQQLTVAGSVFGTPEYMSSEQASGSTVDERTDLYTLGIVLYEMLAGTSPFSERENAAQVILAQLTEPPPPLPAAIDRELSELVMRLLAKDPAERVQRATDLVLALHHIMLRIAPAHPVLRSPTVTRFVTSASQRPPPTEPDTPALVLPQPGAARGVPTAPMGASPPPAELAGAAPEQHAGVSSTPPAQAAFAIPPHAKSLSLSWHFVGVAVVVLILFGALLGGLVVFLVT